MQVEAKEYPNILITGGLNGEYYLWVLRACQHFTCDLSVCVLTPHIDPRVAYWEPAKFVAKLRERKTDNNLLLFKCNMEAGHFSNSGR